MEGLEGRLNDVLESLAQRWEKLASEAKLAAVEAKRAADEIARLTRAAEETDRKMSQRQAADGGLARA